MATELMQVMKYQMQVYWEFYRRLFGLLTGKAPASGVLEMWGYMDFEEKSGLVMTFVIFIQIIVAIILKYRRMQAQKVLKTMVKISVFDSGAPETVKEISVGSLQATMEFEECTPFATEDILRAVKIKTTAYGWASTSFTLVFEDGSTKYESAWHR